MSWPRIALYYTAAIVLALHLQAEYRRQHPVEQAPAATTQPFLEAVPERIDRVLAERDDLSVEFRRRQGRWVVTRPEGISSPSDIVDAVLQTLTSIPPIEVVSEGAERGQYGLNPPRIRLRIESAGEILSTIAFGELNPTRTAVYAKKSGKDEVYLLGLNSRYYLDLVFENVRRQLASAGVALPERASPALAPTGSAPAPPEKTAGGGSAATAAGEGSAVVKKEPAPAPRRASASAAAPPAGKKTPRKSAAGAGNR